MIKDKEFSVSIIDNGFLVTCSWNEGEAYACDKQYAKTLPKVGKLLKQFFSTKDGNVIPF